MQTGRADPVSNGADAGWARGITARIGIAVNDADAYGIPGFLAAYHARAVRWEDHLVTGRLLPMEIRACLFCLVPMVARPVEDDTTVLTPVVRSRTQAPLLPALSSVPADDKAATSNVRRLVASANHAAHGWTALRQQSEGLFVALWNRDRSP